jgi:copper transporter 1
MALLGCLSKYTFRLLFMTYNGWIMLAVAVGAFVGYLLFSPGSAAKSVACH